VDIKRTLFCLENTGLYHVIVVQVLQEADAFVWVENAVQIKWSGGIQRGKTDKVDAERILHYAIRNVDKSKNYEAKSKVIQQLADCLGIRRRFQQSVKSFKVPIKELRSMGLNERADQMEAEVKDLLESLKAKIKSLDKKIEQIIASEEELNKQYKYATSVPCVGLMTACHLLVYTDGFTRFSSSKQLASFAGIAPFEYSSGSSVRGKTRVHHMANKRLKTAIHMSAISSLRHSEEMKTYFARKVGEGKNKMSVINAIRNKLVARVFSCVKNEICAIRKKLDCF